MPVPSLAPDPASCLLVPFAGALDPAALNALRGLKLPHLTELLTHLRALGTAAGPADSGEWLFSPPHERALADAVGLHGSDGALPWAALDSPQPDEPQAWFHPVHFQVGMDQVSLLPAIWLDEARSRQLFDALAPLCAEDGVTLEFSSAQRWRARGERLSGLACASLDRVAGRSVAAWQPRGPQATWLRRLQSEAQMLFYTHPANDALEAAGQPTVNGFWTDSPGAVSALRPLLPPPRVHQGLRHAALQGDWAGWADAWQALDGTDIAALLAQADRAEPVGLILCGERRALHLQSRPGSWLDRWTRRLRRPEHPASLLESL